jgi:Beta-lactamase
MFGKNFSLIKYLCAFKAINNQNHSFFAALVAIMVLLAVATPIVTPVRAETSLRAVPNSLKAASNPFPQLSTSSFPTAGWQTATPQEVGMDPVKFSAAMSLLPSPSMVIRNGRIIGQKGDVTRTGYTWSASKSLLALVFARLLQQGRIANYDAIVPNSGIAGASPATFRQFMSMTSDHRLSPYNPGQHYAYNNGGVHFYGTYLKNTFYPGKTEVQLLREAYGTALGFQDPVSYNTSGYLSGWDGGWGISTRDLARVAYLVLRSGNWNGQQLVPASFINDLYNNQIPVTATAATGTDPFYNERDITTYLPGAYSFGFWLPQRTSVFGTRSQTEATSMLGAFGTSVHISRSTDLMIVAVNTSPGAHGGNRISGAVLDQFAAAIGSTTTPTPTPTPTATPTPTPAPTPQIPTFASGRIAISSDGNDHDCDDITATAMSIALLAKTGNASRLVYYGHSDHIWSTGLDGACAGGNREEEMRISSQETARLWGGFNLNVFINAKAQTATAVSALTNQINASSSTNPLWIIGAGPMEVIGRALAASDPSKRQFVTVVSHSEWNDGHAELAGHGSWNFWELGTTLGAKLVHIIDQNAGLRVDESNYLWLQQSSDPKLNWLWQRHLKSGLSITFDPSDAGMIYWLLTGANNGGDQNATPTKVKAILQATTSPSPTPTPTPTPIPTPIPTPTPTPTPAPTPTTPTPAPSPTPTPGGTLSASLVTAPAGTVLQRVTTGTTINLATLPTRSLSISIVSSVSVGSMKIQHNGVVRTENIAPYSLAGDIDAAYNPANLSAGPHTVIATPYPLADGGGTPGQSLNLSFVVVDNPVGVPPILLTQENSDHAVAFNAATFVREPFSVFTQANLSTDKRTRIVIFANNLDIPLGADTSDLRIHAENAMIGSVPLQFEHVGKVPFFNWLTQIQIILPDTLANVGDVWLRVTWGGASSNQARITIKPSGVAANMPPLTNWLSDGTVTADRRLWWQIAAFRRPRS